jgi:hypothetical protein
VADLFDAGASNLPPTEDRATEPQIERSVTAVDSSPDTFEFFDLDNAALETEYLQPRHVEAFVPRPAASATLYSAAPELVVLAGAQYNDYPSETAVASPLLPLQSDAVVVSQCSLFDSVNG